MKNEGVAISEKTQTGMNFAMKCPARNGNRRFGVLKCQHSPHFSFTGSSFRVFKTSLASSLFVMRCIDVQPSKLSGAFKPFANSSITALASDCDSVRCPFLAVALSLQTSREGVVVIKPSTMRNMLVSPQVRFSCHGVMYPDVPIGVSINMQ